jgi:hypothetical protein
MSLWNVLIGDIKDLVDDECYLSKLEIGGIAFVKCWKCQLALHRDNNLPAIIWYTGAKEWYYHGMCIRME